MPLMLFLTDQAVLRYDMYKYLELWNSEEEEDCNFSKDLCCTITVLNSSALKVMSISTL